MEESENLKVAEKDEEKIIGVCPICGLEMEHGYLAVGSGAAWHKEKISFWSLKGLFSGEIIVGRGLGPYIYNVKAHRCRKCKLVIFKYGNTNESWR